MGPKSIQAIFSRPGRIFPSRSEPWEKQREEDDVKVKLSGLMVWWGCLTLPAWGQEATLDLCNPGGEEAVQDDGFPVGWHNAPGCPLPPPPWIVQEPTRTGAWAFRVEDRDQGGYGLQSTLYPAVPGQMYRASAFVFAEQGAGRLYLEFFRDRAERLWDGHAETTKTGEWERLEVAGVCPDGANYVSCLMYSAIANVGVTYFDDLTLDGPRGAGEPITLERKKVDYRYLYHVGSEKQLFIDDLFFERQENVSLKVHPARKTGEKNLVADRPWETFVINWLTVMADEGRYRMWYECYDQGYTGDQDARYAYAESADGIHWEKPNLGLVEYQGSTDNNLIFDGLDGKTTHGACFFKDPTAPPAERYKTLFLSAHGVAGGYSPDGLHWKAYAQDPILAVPSDTQQVGFWDSRLGKYVAYCRLWTRGRTIGRSESPDFTRFPLAEEVLSCDAQDPPDTDLYNSAALQYPYAANAYFLFTSFYDHPSDHLWIQLATSRDGIVWRRPERVPFVPLGEPGEFDCGHLYMGVGLLRVGDELWHYYQSYPHTHNQQIPQNVKSGGTYSRLIVRLDGYVSADAGPEGGWFETPPLTFTGRRLELNVEVRAGGNLRVGLLDAEGNPVRGRAVADCEPITGDHLRAAVRWNGETDVSARAGQPTRLRVEFRTASLYAFQFVE